RQLVHTGIEFTVDCVQLYRALQIVGLNAAVDTGSMDLSRHILHVKPAIDEFDFVEPRVPGHGDGVFHAGRVAMLIVVTKIESVVAARILGVDRKLIRLGLNLDLDSVETLLLPGALYRVHFDFVAVPGGDMDGAVKIVDLDAALRRKRVNLVKFLGEAAILIRSQSGAADDKNHRECACRYYLPDDSAFLGHNASVRFRRDSRDLVSGRRIEGSN